MGEFGMPTTPVGHQTTPLGPCPAVCVTFTIVGAMQQALSHHAFLLVWTTTAPARFGWSQGLLFPALRWSISHSDVRIKSLGSLAMPHTCYVGCHDFFMEIWLALPTPWGTMGWTTSRYNWSWPVGSYGSSHFLPLPCGHAYSMSYPRKNLPSTSIISQDGSGLSFNSDTSLRRWYWMEFI